MQLIFYDQRQALESLQGLSPPLDGNDGKHPQKPIDIVDRNIKAVKVMEDHAEETCNAVCGQCSLLSQALANYLPGAVF